MRKLIISLTATAAIASAAATAIAQAAPAQVAAVHWNNSGPCTNNCYRV
jgi:hypothetical protein